MTAMARNPAQLAAIIRRERKAAGLTQKQLGEKIGLRQATVSTLEQGLSTTRLSTLFDALAALNLEIVVQPRSAQSSPAIEELF